MSAHVWVLDRDLATGPERALWWRLEADSSGGIAATRSPFEDVYPNDSTVGREPLPEQLGSHVWWQAI